MISRRCKYLKEITLFGEKMNICTQDDHDIQILYAIGRNPNRCITPRPWYKCYTNLQLERLEKLKKMKNDNI